MKFTLKAAAILLVVFSSVGLIADVISFADSRYNFIPAQDLKVTITEEFNV